MENWKSVPRLNNHYEVSDLGNFRSKDRIVTYSDGRKVKSKGRDLKLHMNRNGYYYVHTSFNQVEKKEYVHRLVAEMSCPNPDSLPVVNHINGIKTDNTPSNLEWCTRSHNQKHSYGTSLRKGQKGEKHGRSKLTRVDVLEIRSSIESANILSLKYKVSPATIRDIKSRRSWAHIV